MNKNRPTLLLFYKDDASTLFLFSLFPSLPSFPEEALYNCQRLFRRSFPFLEARIAGATILQYFLMDREKRKENEERRCSIEVSKEETGTSGRSRVAGRNVTSNGACLEARRSLETGLGRQFSRTSLFQPAIDFQND